MLNPTVESMDTAVDMVVVQKRKRVTEKAGVPDAELKEELAVLQQFRFKVQAFWLLFLSVYFHCSDPRTEQWVLEIGAEYCSSNGVRIRLSIAISHFEDQESCKSVLATLPSGN